MNIICCLLFTITFFTSLAASSSHEALAVFPKTQDELQKAFIDAKNEAECSLRTIIALANEERTFENTIKAFDTTVAAFDVPYSAVSTLEMVHPDPILRQKAEELTAAYKEFIIDNFETNRAIYQAFIDYRHTSVEPLSEERAYHLEQAIDAFKGSGLQLDNTLFARVTELSKKICALGSQFYSNIALDNSYLLLTQEQLSGVDKSFIDTLDKEGESYILQSDSPTYQKLLSTCDLESTRKAYYHFYTNKAYPKNLVILQELVLLRHELALLLGYENYAEFDIAGQMAQTPHAVQLFLEAKAQSGIPEAVKTWELIAGKEKIAPWNSSYLAHQYKKKTYQIDHAEIASYFSFEKTLEGMFSVFGKFLDMEFTFIQTDELWHPQARLVEVKELQNGSILGYLVLDLFPRANKYTHCCCMSIASRAVQEKAVAVIITNSSQSFLTHAEVITLFHEFGHAIHALWGKAEMATKSATHTVHDFVEAPSQLFEEWATDPEILTLISCHYKTGKPLAQDVISRLILARDIDDSSSATTSSELFYGLQSLQFFQQNPHQDLRAAESAIQKKTRPWLIDDPDDNSLCTFEHLVGYGAKYYTYLWSKEIAKELFAYIKARDGLQDPQMGRRYISKIISRGGAVHPNQLLNDFFSPDKEE